MYITLKLMGICFVSVRMTFRWILILSFLAHGLSIVLCHHALAVPLCICHQICISTTWP